MNATNALFVIAFCLVAIAKDKTITKPDKKELLPDFKIIWGNIIVWTHCFCLGGIGCNW